MSALLVRDEDGVRLLTLARPPGNALDLALLADLGAAAADAGHDVRVRAVILASGVPGYFSSGLDLHEMARLPEARRAEPFEALVAAYRALLGLPKPTVAAMAGPGILGGWILAMACDWRLLAAGARIALSEIRAGLSPTTALIARLESLACDPRAVKEMVLRGQSLGADRALAAALVDGVLPEEEVLPEAQRLAKRLVKSPPRAYAQVKRALNAAATDGGQWPRAMAEFKELFSGPEAREGVAALRDKRRPRWEDA